MNKLSDIQSETITDLHGVAGFSLVVVVVHGGFHQESVLACALRDGRRLIIILCSSIEGFIIDIIEINTFFYYIDFRLFYVNIFY